MKRQDTKVAKKTCEEGFFFLGVLGVLAVNFSLAIPETICPMSGGRWLLKKGIETPRRQGRQEGMGECLSFLG